jgi:hypothetical protein
MGYIKDFVVIPQTKPDIEADKLVSEFIKKDKAKNNARLKKKLEQASKA